MTESYPETVNVAITGAAGQIGYSLLPEILKGRIFGDRIVNLNLLELPDAMDRLRGVVMELEDTASPNLGTVKLVDTPEAAFEGVNFAFLVGAIPRQKGMDRADLLAVNAPIFARQGRALNENAADDVRVLVVANPANANALLTMASAPDIPVERFSAMTRLDHNRVLGHLALELGVTTDTLHKVAVWGNHSDTMVVDLSHTTVNGEVLPNEFLPDTARYQTFAEKVAKRGGAIIEARGASSAMSAAKAAADHARDWLQGTDEWVSMGVYSHGEYDVPEGLISSYPVTTRAPGEFSIVKGLTLPDTTKERLAKSVAELVKEKEAMQGLGLLTTER